MPSKNPVNDWSPENVSNFWNYLGSRADLFPDYFTYQFSEGVTNFLKYTGMLVSGNRVLDFGCGPGFLIERLLEESVECFGADSSQTAVQHLVERFSGHPRWKGAAVSSSPRLNYPDEFFSLVTCLETLEHLDQSTSAEVLFEIRRVLSGEGLAVFTAPFEEDLSRSFIKCPFCSKEYHRIQHVRSFSVSSLMKFLQDAGFRVVFCDTIDFEEFQPQKIALLDLSLRLIRKRVGDVLRNQLDRCISTKFPNNRLISLYRGKKGTLCAVVSR